MAKNKFLDVTQLVHLYNRYKITKKKRYNKVVLFVVKNQGEQLVRVSYSRGSSKTSCMI